MTSGRPTAILQQQSTATSSECRGPCDVMSFVEKPAEKAITLKTKTKMEDNIHTDLRETASDNAR